MKPGRSALEEMIRGCGFQLSSKQLDQLWAYHRMLRAANAELNMTRIHNFENMVLKHYVDSLLVLNFEELPSPLMDMGSGPGLPGVPLKIASPNTQMILAEPRGARALFLEEVCETLKLDQVEVLDSKVTSKLRRRVAGVITRAVASIPETLDRVANCLEPGGRMLFMKGPECDDEIREARGSHASRFKLVADHAYQIPGTPHDRRLVVYERLEEPARGKGQAGAGTPVFSGSEVSITSEANPTFKLCRDLLGGRGIRKQGRALLSGARPIAEVLEHAPDHAEGWLTDSQGSPPPRKGLTWYRLSDALFQTLDASGTHSPLLLVRVPEMPEWTDEAPWPTGCTLFVPFQDPENVGAVIRSAAAFGAARVVLLREAAHPFHPKAARAAGPALFQVPLWHGPSIQELVVRQVPLIALATDGPELGSAPFPSSFGLVPGIEGPGLPAHLREGTRRHIPMDPRVESLNAATATAVALYAWRLSCPATANAASKPEQPVSPNVEAPPNS